MSTLNAPQESLWVAEACRRLAVLGRPEGSWSYVSGQARAVEPTALAGLACLATGSPTSAAKAGRWLTSLRQADGSLGASTQLATPGWPTPLAVLLWAALGVHPAERGSAVCWLLDRRGVQIPRVPNDPLGHDGMLIGWPWVAATHSWVEPTALALLALGREGQSKHARSREGVRVLLDRAIPGGGWNLGNPVVFGTALRPFPGPTGLALLALAQLGEGRSATVERALLFLQGMIESTLAPQSLGWAVLGLRAWGVEPRSTSTRLALAAGRLLAKPAPGGLDLALLLLADAPGSLGLLGLEPRTPGAAHVH